MNEPKPFTLLAIILGVILLVSIVLSFQITSLQSKLVQINGTLQNFTNAQLNFDNEVIQWSQTVTTRLGELENKTK